MRQFLDEMKQACDDVSSLDDMVACFSMDKVMEQSILDISRKMNKARNVVLTSKGRSVSIDGDVNFSIDLSDYRGNVPVFKPKPKPKPKPKESGGVIGSTSQNGLKNKNLCIRNNQGKEKLVTETKIINADFMALSINFLKV